MTDNDYKPYRDALVEKLRERGISDEKVLQAIANVPRHLFVDKDLSPWELYRDEPLPIGQGQTISQPYTVAYQTELLKVLPGDKVLEIGTGSGYQSAVLRELGASVYTIERQVKLYESTKKRFERLGYTNIFMVLGDGKLGIPEHAPYDKVIVTAASEGIPEQLIRQMKTGATMVIPVNGNLQRMKRITKTSDTETKEETFGHFFFVPLLSGIVMK